MMQTLRLMGLQIIGQAFHDNFSHKELNPKGYWDLPIKETWNGLNTDLYKGCAVKLGGYQLSKTDPKYVKKIIVCERNKDATIASILRIMKADIDISGIKPTVDNAEMSYNSNSYLIDEYVKNKEHIRIKYEDMLLKTKETSLILSRFLQIVPEIDPIIDNIIKGKVCQLQQS